MIEAEKKSEKTEPGYPSWRYHLEFEAKIIRSKAEDEALGGGWERTPAAFGRDTADAPGAVRFVPSEARKIAPPKSDAPATAPKRKYTRRAEVQA